MVFVTGFAETKSYPAATVDELKAFIENDMFVPSHMISIVSSGSVLTGGLLDASVDEVEAVFGADAGMRAKWRKKRMRRLRRKRRKMRQRAR
mmetsp:Transcript_8195/g.16410  ORF Transcript_8195/g.16410 Transcript_8195/m.16410 type:complete len:92 (-) Transcript_8195:169-444(-)|eukprot:CAMPEP_0182452698 /NCGR_PEP_ID=MMETSP1319-20130603/44_1 /TAXON_ID=172717 /ORGANISM="Bolidomonas pacifica, Strain RCC208" /LENGTH=91 /DNA_ID=CAMNT_0024650547 /DNA_START=384 /DNA_END=659 /DNA_ORIENTATION=-